MIIVTNNLKTRDYYEKICGICFVEGSYQDVLKTVRDLIHKGHKLLTHPLSGSVKPIETPYESVAVSDVPGTEGLDFDSLMIIEDSIVMCRNFELADAKKDVTHVYDRNAADEDFMDIDLSLMQSAGLDNK